MRVRSTTRGPGNHGFSFAFLVIPQFQQEQVSRRLWMRASSRLNLPSIDFLWVNCHPKEECFSVGRAIDCRGIYTKSIGRWFDSGCWDLHFFLRGGGPRPTLRSETETRSNERTGTRSGIRYFTCAWVFLTNRYKSLARNRRLIPHAPRRAPIFVREGASSSLRRTRRAADRHTHAARLPHSLSS